MKIVFRADASSALGSGHVMRCLALAEALREAGARVSFLSRDLPGNLNGMVAGLGFELLALPGESSDWNQEDDARACLAALPDRPDWLVVDHYALSRTWEQACQRALGGKAVRILAIDDLADRPHDCDLLLDQNPLPASRYADLIPSGCTLLLGPNHALLRPQFAAARQALAPRDGTVRRILVSYGGGDAGGETLKALAAIARLGRPGLAIDVVIGQANPHAPAIEAACGKLPGCAPHRQMGDMAALMASADLALGAGGGTAWERCCLGLPALVSALADNQVAPARALAEAGCQFYLGWADDLGADDYARHLADLLSLPELLRHMGRQGMALVDGRGAQRVARHVLAADLGLRPAGTEDSADLLAWRNHPDNRRHAFNPAPIPEADHARWLAAVLADADRILLIAEDAGSPVGVLRYDLAGATATVSVYLVPGLAGRGYGRRLLRAGEDWLAGRRPEVVSIRAELRADNGASVAAFRAAGYRHAQSVFTKEIHGTA